ncbi:haloalkane dehalogenase [Algiphilus sp. NNCM1]|mgnify:CR=1 FL=1|jgi:haloalkane dehalogenase|nr:haloalkane dehalogenase [Algiphilus acroporae]
MKILRTPDERFSNLPDFPWAPRYVQLGDLRMHYVEAGPSDGKPVLLLHGEPTWSYLYRKMIPVFAEAGYRAIAPDLIGFGRSDKPSLMSDYSYQRHVDWVLGLIVQLDLKAITLVCQDWGSLIGLRLAAEHQDRFARITVGNGALPTASSALKIPAAFKLWRAFAKYSPWFPIGGIVKTGCATKLTPQEIDAYDAPFPDDSYKAGTRAFPRLVPTDESNPAIPANRAAWAALGKWDKPFLTVFGALDPILGKADRSLQAHVPGASGQPHARLRASHFLQEDVGEEWARRTVDWMRA